jgi:hypothetical protein
MRAVYAAFWIGVVLIATPCWGRVLPLDQQGQASTPAPTHIADDEWAMIELACRKQQQSHSHSAYMDCLSRQVKALEASPGKPSLASLTSEERGRVQAACASERLHMGPAAYYDCLFKQKLVALTGTPGKPPGPANASDQATGNAGAAEARSTPMQASSSSRTSQPVSGTSAQAAKQQNQPAPQDTAANLGSNSAPAAAATPALTRSRLEVLAIVLVGAIVVWLSWSVYRGFRGPKCAKCGRRFQGAGAYCAKCLAALRERVRQDAAQERHADEQARADENRQRQEGAWEDQQRVQQPKNNEADNAFDPYVVLGVARDASKEEVRAAYLQQIAKYHPDKVAHLGADLQELAKQKAQALNRAYEALLQAT